MRIANYLIVVYPFNGGNVYSRKVSCRHEPTWSDISRLEKIYNARVEVINLNAK